MNKTLALLNLNLILVFSSISAQENFSLATGATVLRNFSPQQTFWAAGHTIQANLHFSSKQSAYAWIEYYTESRFRNNFAATAKSAATSPQIIPFVATGRLTYRHFSLGWKHYFKGGYAEEKDLSFYGLAGFGFLFASMRNEFSTAIDATAYNIPTTPGETGIRKLTFDLGGGAEMPIAGNTFIFADLRTWLPASSNESAYLHNQRNVPLPFMLSIGLRVVIGSLQE